MHKSTQLNYYFRKEEAQGSDLSEAPEVKILSLHGECKALLFL